MHRSSGKKSFDAARKKNETVVKQMIIYLNEGQLDLAEIPQVYQRHNDLWTSTHSMESGSDICVSIEEGHKAKPEGFALF